MLRKPKVFKVTFQYTETYDVFVRASSQEAARKWADQATRRESLVLCKRDASCFEGSLETCDVNQTWEHDDDYAATVDRKGNADTTKEGTKWKHGKHASWRSRS